MSDHPQTLTSLPDVVAMATRAGEQIDLARQRYEIDILPEIIVIGVAALAAQEHHRLPEGKRNPKGRNQHSGRPRPRMDVASPVEVHPGGFHDWREVALPSLGRSTVYKYMTCALGLGLTAWSTEQQARDAVAAALRKVDRLNLADLERQGRLIASGGEIPPPPKPAPKPADTYEALSNLHAYTAQVEALADKFSFEQKEAALNDLIRAAEKISGVKWIPAT